MKRYLKIFFLALASLVLAVFTTVMIAVWFVFTPARITPVVKNQLAKLIQYQTEIGEVEFTFFSTFPHFAVRVNGFAIISPADGAACDTLFKCDELTGVINAKAYWKSGDLIIHKFILSNGSLNTFSDSLGQSNYGLFLDETGTASPESPEITGSLIDLVSIELVNLNISYTDLASEITASVTGLTAKLSGVLRDENFTGHIDIGNANILFESDANNINTSISGLSAKLSGYIGRDNFRGNIDMINSIVTFQHDGEKYLDNAHLKFSSPMAIELASQCLRLDEAFASINGLGIVVSGSLQYGMVGKDLATNIGYELNSWQIKEVMALIPQARLADYGIVDASGIISSKGTIKGILNDSLVPVMDISLALNRGNLVYESLPFPLSGMSGDLRVYSDINNDTVSWLDISHFEGKTPGSVFKTRGKVNHLFSDMHIDLITDASILADEFRSFIPDDMNLTVSGRISGWARTGFTMSQLANFEMEKMKISGSASLSGFSMVYDSISISTVLAGIDFSLPNPSITDRNTKFAFLKIASDKLETAIASGNAEEAYAADFKASLENAHIYLEISDVRDTTIIPDIFCTFSFDSLRAGADTINISIDKPYGYFSVSPGPYAPLQPAIKLAYTSYDLRANMGRNSIVMDNITINTDIVNDNAREDIFLKWLVKGFIDMNNAAVSLSAFSHPVEIPAIKMEFEPEIFNISEGRIIIDKSDFSLTGIFSNVLSYFRGDSILRGGLNFASDNINLVQLMELTSGFGADNDEVNTTSSTGPYMVPRGVDMLLRANVRQATRDNDTITDILGDVRIKDGVLVLDELTFTTPAADMQLTAVYRTPRKNHLYLYLDYHMLDVEIGRLLEMLPDLDTLMPMLRSFRGTGEFHIAAETYLDSLYNIKKSTLRGASSIMGTDLVLMDGETFGEIAKTFRFSRRAENRVDSLSAEFTIFREEIEVYPFLLVMDRYKVVVGGMHNFDLSFDYHISMVESPLPIRLGIDIDGTMEQMKYRITPRPQFAEFYRPGSRRAVESNQMELRKMIREALLRNVRE
jgi:hypothetical protein